MSPVCVTSVIGSKINALNGPQTLARPVTAIVRLIGCLVESNMQTRRVNKAIERYQGDIPGITS